LDDKLASLYLRPSNLIVRVLLKGKSAGEANERSKKMILKNIKKIFASSSSDKEDTVRWLYHNYCIQTVIGDGQKKCF